MKELLLSYGSTMLSGMALLVLIVCVEVFGLIAGWFTPLYTVPFLIVPAFWAFLLFLSYGPMRKAASADRILQIITSAGVLGALLSLSQWVAIIVMSSIINAFSETISYALKLFLILAYTFVEATVLGAIPEEVFKFCLLHLIAWREPLPSRYGIVMYTVAASLGFVIVSGTWRLVRVFGVRDPTIQIAYFAVETLLVSTMQIVAGLWIGLNFNRQRFPEVGQEATSWWQVLMPPLLFHAVFTGFIAVMFLLFDYNALHWSVYALIFAFSIVFLILALGLNLAQAKKLLTNPSSYAPLLDSQGVANKLDDGYGEDEL